MLSLFWTTVNIRKPQPAMSWRELAEKATNKEQDPEKLMAIVEELTGSVTA